MVEWLAGNRIKGTSTERTAGTPEVPEVPAVSGGWKELGRSSNSSLPDVTSLADKKYLMFLNFQESNASRPVPSLRLNGDSGSTYTRRGAYGGGSDYTNTSKTLISFSNQPSTNATVPYFTVGYIANKSDKEKLMIINNTYSETGVGASNEPQRVETVGKWTNTSEAVDQLSIVSSTGDSFNTNGELVVLGYDPDDTHTTNFWEQLASVELSSSGDTLSSVTITAKKYLWVQSFTKGTGGATRSSYTMNSDGGNNYGYRYSVDDATDATGSGQGNLYFNSNTTGNTLTNSFIINNSANEKLVISHTVKATSTGASTAPSREENVGKWSNTSAQITSIQMLNSGAGSFDTGSIIKVWGSD